MTTQTANYLEAIGHLPAGGTLILTDVPWKDYEQLLHDLGKGYAVRISYDQGRLEIMSPSHKHENFKELISRLAHVIAEELDIVLESLGSTTYKQEWLSRGVEPDACFYIQNAARIIGRESIDLRTDPPPDVVVEIDVSHDSTSKLAIYAGMRVPELWRYDGKRARLYSLMADAYVEIPSSQFLPIVSCDLLTRFLEQSKTQGQSATLRSFREWLRGQR
ncbi:MAG TPA: Uma2 family endonuclease [Pyrinomonadaceae bacterium]|nr:Uma2 family endonuclease [Pyrinomonadaceae bacterium]